MVNSAAPWLRWRRGEVGAVPRRIEQRHAPEQPLDVLVQHLVTVALGGGFVADELFEELRTTHAQGVEDTLSKAQRAEVKAGRRRVDE